MGKRIIVCADGTWNSPEQTEGGVPCPTNVVRTAQAIRPTDPGGIPQVVYYHKGVGKRGGWWDHLSGGAFGVGIYENIEEIYLFLVNNYVPGDELFLFGFSRGAYTVRTIAGLIRNCGILKPEFMSKYAEAYEIYRDRSASSHPKSDGAVAFRRRNAWPDFNIHFIGVWETVGSLGVPVVPLRFWRKRLYEFHDLVLSSHVDHAYQALAVDERRKSFRPSVWVRQGDPGHQVLEQEWFPGSHSDVGGGYAANGLSDVALNWMWERATACGLVLKDWPLAADPLAPMNDSMNLCYRMMGDGTRLLGRNNPAGAEAAHTSALERVTRDASYRPANLLTFLGFERGWVGCEEGTRNCLTEPPRNGRSRSGGASSVDS